MLSSIYYFELKNRIIKEGFHATDNHPDMRAELYKLLPLLNYRSYFVIVKKDSPFFREQMKNKDESDFFEYSLKTLLSDRITSGKDDKNIFYFENINLSKRSLKEILDNLFLNSFNSYDCEYHIVDKKNENMAIIDYLNFIFSELLTKNPISERMEQNLRIVAPKIGLVHFIHKKIFLARKKTNQYQVTVENIITNF